MKLEQLQTIPVFQTAGLAATLEADPRAARYVVDCLQRYFNGDFGETPPEDVALNNAELESGEGRIVARYKAAEGLEENIFIISYFSESNPGELDYNNTTIMYCSEY